LVFRLWIALLFGLMALGLYGWIAQWTQGLVVTAMRDIVFWGIYIANFTFWVGASAGGLVVVAIVYVFGVEKFKPITRIAEVQATISLIIALMFILPDLGRPDRILNLILYPNLASPFIWDFAALSVYLVLCIVFGWYLIRGRELPFITKTVSAVALVSAISIHSVTAWIFGLMKARPGWLSALMAPVFLSSALVSGLALLILSTFVASRLNRISVKPSLLSDLAKILLAIIPVDLFLLFCEIFTAMYSAVPEHVERLNILLWGNFSLVFWTEILVGGLLPFLILSVPKARRLVVPVVIASMLALLGVLLKRLNLLFAGLIVSTLGEVGYYFPTWIEWSIVLGIYSFGLLLASLSLNFLPLQVGGIGAEPKVGLDAGRMARLNGGRREFISKGMPLLVLAPLLQSLGVSAAETTAEVKKVQKWAMVVDLRKCIGCQACFAACKNENGVPKGMQYTWVETHEQGKYPNIQLNFLPRLCNHCDKPPCVDACPVTATYKREDGIVMQDVNRCIGCRYCMAACPYEVRSFVWGKVAGAWPETWRGVAKSEQGFVVKCHGCFHRIDNGLKPACVEVCVGGARIFGDLADHQSAVRKLFDSVSTRGFREYLGTFPKVYYIGLPRIIEERGSKAPGVVIVHE